ncbi:MAG: hypothetical protein HYV13_04205 [Candidatus Doudnabacteria bacterium]|nr:hypothetical protein [Candidatus Doudnabacteria bacterium]
MARLETQIKQIFLTHPQNLESSQVLYDERLTEHTHLFLVMELGKSKRKTNPSDLKKISEIILSTFRANKKLPAETMFENSLAEINQRLSDLVHKNRSSWLPNFSAALMLKSQNQIFLASTGAAMGMLKRGRELSRILEPEKKIANPLKIFENFSIGKIKEDDLVILTLSNVFNFISQDLFARVLNEDPQEAINVFSKILNAAGSEEQFSCFILRFTKEAMPLPASEEIFAPLPEAEMALGSDHREPPPLAEAWRSIQKIATSPGRMTGLLAMGKKYKLHSWQRLPPARKFFLASFLIFILIFGINLIAYGFKASNRKTHEKINQQINKLSEVMREAEASLIYKDDQKAFTLLAQAWDEYRNLEHESGKQAGEIKPILLELDARINRITQIPNPELATELKFAPLFIVRAGSGFLLANKDISSLSFFDKTARNIFLINNPTEELRGIAHVSGLGHVFATADKIYLVNETKKQVELLKTIANADIRGIKFASPNRLYVLDKNSNQILRLNFSGRALSTPQPMLKTQLILSDIQDFGLDKDIYLLSKTSITRIVNGLPQAFKLPALSQPLADSSRITVAANIYILEPNTKRLLIFGKNGSLLNQIVFNGLTSPSDFIVDETQRTIQLLSGNRLYSITY